MADATRRSHGRFIPWLALAVAAVCGLWTAGWFWASSMLATRLDGEIARLAARGITVRCDNRAITGFPFRLSLACDSSGVTWAPRRPDRGRPGVALADAQPRGDVAGLRAVALVTNPTAVILEADAPLAARLPDGGAVRATWSSLRSSASGLLGDPRLSIVATDIDVTATSPATGETLAIKAVGGELHGRRTPESAAEDGFALDLAGQITGIDAARDGKPLAIAGIGVAGIRLAFDATLGRLPQPVGDLRAMLRAWASRGGTLDIRSVRISLGALAVGARGKLAMGAGGHLDGKLAITAFGLDRDTGTTEPSLPQPVKAAMQAFRTFGRPVDEEGQTGRGLELTLKGGKIKLGPLTLGEVPPLPL